MRFPVNVPHMNVHPRSIAWPDRVLVSRGPHGSTMLRYGDAISALEASCIGVAHLVRLTDTGAIYRTRRRWLRRPFFSGDWRRPSGDGRLTLIGFVVIERSQTSRCAEVTASRWSAARSETLSALRSALRSPSALNSPETLRGSHSRSGEHPAIALRSRP